MLELSEYEMISELAKKAGVVRPIMLRALLHVADESEVIVKARQIKAERKKESDEAEKKRDALLKLASSLDMKDLEALIMQAQQAEAAEDL